MNGRLSRVFLMPLAILLVGLSVTLVGGAALYDHQQHMARESLLRRADAVQRAVLAETARYESAVSMAAAALSTQDDITQQSFETATAPLAGMELAGATSIALIAPPVPTAQVAELQAYWRARGSTGLKLQPADGEVHLFSVMGVPLDGSGHRPINVDITAASPPYGAVTEASRTGAVTISEPYQLLIDQDLPAGERQTSFSLTAPVWGTVGTERELRGWVIMGIRGHDFVGTVLQNASQGQVSVELLAGDASGLQTFVAGYGPGASGHDLSYNIQVPVAQRTWTLRAAGDVGPLIGSAAFRPTLVTLTGLIVSVLVSVLVRLLLSGRLKADEAVRQATSELAVAEQDARQQSALLTAVLDSISDAVVVVDETGTFVVHNPAARLLLGLDGAAAELFLPDGAPFPSAELPLVRALAGENLHGVEMIVRNEARPGGVHVSVSARPLDPASGQTGAVAVFHDVTLEREQQAETSAFAGVVAHDLKNPLMTVSGYLELLEDVTLPRLDGEPHDLATARDQVARARAATQRMDSLIVDLLGYTTARDASLTLDDVDLEMLVSEVVEGHKERARQRPGLLVPAVHIGELPPVRADRDRLRQVVDNLVGNAVKYSVPGRQPLISITATGGDTHQVSVQVADRGIGIPPDQLADVFTPFHRAHRGEQPGTGLGLAICQRIVTRHGGTIAASPNPGGGTVFTLTLPAAPAETDKRPTLETRKVHHDVH
ncbi:MAG TPA: ATP-binding protein [Nocardioidaceae bacterium]|nr:ATP-binding protein [Nocardioidaceae bacterium]